MFAIPTYLFVGHGADDRRHPASSHIVGGTVVPLPHQPEAVPVRAPRR